MIEEIYNKLPNKPYCTDSFECGIRIRSKKIASKAKHIQLNSPTHKHFFVFDVDRNGAAMDWYDLKVPAPNITIQNPSNGHAHLVYGLSTPVRTANNAKIKPLRYAAAIENALCTSLDADRGYCGLMAKNPLNNFWRVKEWNSYLYCLDELADSLDLFQQAKNDADYGMGRNCSLFDYLRSWAYKAIRQGWPDYDRWLMAVEQRAHAYNNFPSQLSISEVKGIAKSVAKWTYKHFSEKTFSSYIYRTHTSDIQAVRGAKGGKKSKGGGRPSLNSPWIEMGISRATYFRKKSENRL